jgi:hypothetical protein
MRATIDYSGTLTSGTLEEGFAKESPLESNSVEEILLCMRRVDYIELAALFTLNSFLAAAEKRKKRILIELPDSKFVRDFLVVWRYPESVQALMLLPFKSYLTERSARLYSERQVEFSDRGNDISMLEWDADWKEGSRTKRNFFEITTLYRRNECDVDSLTDPSISYPLLECDRWQRPLIKAILDKHLARPNSGSDIAKIVVYEAISNAVRHPNATVIQTGSVFQSHKNVPKSFRLCIWDNGDAIPQTLLPLVVAGKPIRTKLLVPMWLTESIELRKRHFGRDWEQETKVINEADDVNAVPGSEDWLLFFSSFPGVSREASATLEMQGDFDMESLGTPSLPNAGRGIGLFALRRVVVTQLQGSLTIRSGQYQVKFSPAKTRVRSEKQTTVSAEMTSYKRSGLPYFQGNLLSISIPVRSNEPAQEMPKTEQVS